MATKTTKTTKTTKKAAAKKPVAKKAATKKPVAKMTPPPKKAVVQTAAKKTASKKALTFAHDAVTLEVDRRTLTDAMEQSSNAELQRTTQVDRQSLAAAVAEYEKTSELHRTVPVSRDDIDAAIRAAQDDGVAPCLLAGSGDDVRLVLQDDCMPHVRLFQERGLSSTGSTWEALVESLVRLRRPELQPLLSYETDSQNLVVRGPLEALHAVAGLVRLALEKSSVLKDALDRADPDRLD
jgi:hypothetical protein